MESLGRSLLEARDMAVMRQAGFGSVMSVVDGPGCGRKGSGTERAQLSSVPLSPS